MRIVKAKEIYEQTKILAKEANFSLDECLINRLRKGYNTENDLLAKKILEEILDNIQISKRDHIPLCQDTGLVVVFLEIGNEVFIEGDLYEAINKGVSDAYIDEYLRMSVVEHPLKRINTNKNTPAIIHETRTKGSKIKLAICPKGAGSENMSQIKMLTPSDGKDGIIDFVLSVIKKAGGNACPPLQIGIGIGGNFEECALLAKKALLCSFDSQNYDEIAQQLEEELLRKINSLNIGPMGFGGNLTALSVKILCAPCHIASLPVAVNLQCHVARHKEVII